MPFIGNSWRGLFRENEEVWRQGGYFAARIACQRRSSVMLEPPRFPFCRVQHPQLWGMCWRTRSLQP
jgi:hypothetical protein